MSDAFARVLPWICPATERRTDASPLGRGVGLLLLVLWSVHYFTVSLRELGQSPGVLHLVHLVFHEAGHAITGVITGSRTLVVFMGSGMQVLVPLIVAVAQYWKRADGFAAAIGLWWAGHALLDVAPYIADARVLQLQLISGGTGREVEGHDWEYLLGEWHALSLDVQIAWWVALAARALMLVAFLWAAVNLIHDRSRPAPPP